MAESSPYTYTDPILVYQFSVDFSSSGVYFEGYFTECDLPDVEWDMQEVKEGGLNTYSHQIPGRRKATKLILKNGLSRRAEFLSWYSQLMSEKYQNYRQTVTIKVLDRTDEHREVLGWTVHNACLTKITWPNLKAGENTVAIQSLEFACGDIELTKIG